jgi:hypothetical protein
MFEKYRNHLYSKNFPTIKIISNNKLSPIKNGFSYLARVCSANFGFQSRISGSREILAATNPPIEVFSSAIILDLLSGTQILPNVILTLKKFLVGQDEYGIFNFFENTGLLADDVDCTALCLRALLKEGSFDRGRAKIIARLLISNINEEGIIQVYLPPRSEREGRVDAVVCANVMCLLYQLGLDSEAKKTEDFLYQTLENKAYLNGTLYYPSPDAFLYFLSRAISVSPAALRRFENLLAMRIRERFGATSRPLDLAMRILAADRINLLQIEEDQLLEIILPEKQKLEKLQRKEDGAWPKDALFKTGRMDIYFGSKALTTAFAVKALEALQGKPVIRELISVFPVVIQSQDVIAELKTELTNWLNHHRLFSDFTKDKRDSIVNVSCCYAKYCSPSGSSFDNLRMANQFLLLLLWFANDYNDSQLHPEFPDILLSILDVMEGRPPANKSKIISETLDKVKDFRADLLIKSTENKMPISTFIHSIKQGYAAFLWEWKVKCKPVDFKAYNHYRLFSILTYPWFELWKILNKLEISLDLTINPELCELEKLAVEIIYMHNDVGSVDQDLKKNKQNIVLILHREKGLLIETAANEVRNSIEEKIERFTGLSVKLEARNSSALSEYINFLKSCVQGNIISMIELKERYNPTYLENKSSDLTTVHSKL